MRRERHGSLRPAGASIGRSSSAAPVADGDRQRLAGLLQRRRACTDARCAGGAGRASCSRRAPTSWTSAASRPPPGRPPVAVGGGDRARRAADRARRRRARRARLGRHLQAGRGARRDRRRGARIVNDVSGLRDPELADVCAQTGAALVVMHTRAAPKQRLQDPDLYGDVLAEVLAFLRERIDVALERRRRPEQLIVDPGRTSPRPRRRRSGCCASSSACTSSGGRC